MRWRKGKSNDAESGPAGETGQNGAPLKTDPAASEVDAAAPRDERDKKAMAGLRRTVERIKNFPHRYTDDSGAQFIKDYFDISPERALGFFKRVEKQGFGVKLTDEETNIMEGVRPRTSPMGLLPQATIGDGVRATMTRRNFLRKGRTVALGLGVDYLSQRTHGVTDGLKAKTEEMALVQANLDQGGLAKEERDKLIARKEQLKKELTAGPMGEIGSFMGRHPMLLTTLGIVGYQTYRQGADVYDHANQKVDKIINFLSSVINHKMGYTPASAFEGGVELG